MGYNLAILGCGTMGVAILSGVLKSLEARLSLPLNPDADGDRREPPSGISTPTASQFLDAPDSVLPSRFITTVGREETIRKLKKVFKDMGRLGEAVEVRGGGGVNVQAVQEADVILVWYVYGLNDHHTKRSEPGLMVARSPIW
jgi:pyrroline-5-carboxylate reductase